MGSAAAFDVFILSDTRDEREGAAEESAYRALRHRLKDASPSITAAAARTAAARPATSRTGCAASAAAYEHFVILDGDSVMSGTTLVRLALAMQRDPSAGLIQTVPRLTGATTLLQYLTQFASNVYGPLGRCRPRLLASRPGQLLGPQRHHPHRGVRVRGRPADAARPAAVRRRHPEPRLRRGSAAAARRLGRPHGADARGLLRGPAADAARSRRPRPALGAGQPAAPRHRVLARHHDHGPPAPAHGRLSYLVSSIWAASLLVGLVLALQGQQMIPSYFLDEKTLFPIWPVIDPGAALRLFFATMVVVLLPKALGLALEIKRARHAREAVRHAARGARRRHRDVVLDAARADPDGDADGRGVPDAVRARLRLEARSAATMPASRSWRRCAITAGTCSLASLMAVACYEASPLVLAWMSPVMLGLVLSAPLNWLTSRPAGPAAARAAVDARGAQSAGHRRERAPATGEWADHIALRSTETAPVVEIAHARRLGAVLPGSPCRRCGGRLRQHIARAHRRRGDERQRPAHLDARRADAGGQRAVEGAFAEPPREAAQQILPEELPEQVVGQGDAAGGDDVADDEPGEPQRAERARTSAVQARRWRAACAGSRSARRAWRSMPSG